MVRATILSPPKKTNLFLFKRSYYLGQFSPLLLKGTWLELPFCFLTKESPFFHKASSLKKLPKGCFSIHFVHRNKINKLNLEPFD
jgi:hypothetical protein